MKCEKLQLPKIVGNLLASLDELRKLYMNGMVIIEIFSQVKENSRQNLPLQTDVLQKTVGP